MTAAGGSAVAERLERTWLVSSNSHIVEPPELWAGRGGALAERMPRVVSEADGEWWYVDGRKTMSFLGFQTGARFEKEREALRTSAAFAEVRSRSCAASCTWL